MGIQKNDGRLIDDIIADARPDDRVAIEREEARVALIKKTAHYAMCLQTSKAIIGRCSETIGQMRIQRNQLSQYLSLVGYLKERYNARRLVLSEDLLESYPDLSTSFHYMAQRQGTQWLGKDVNSSLIDTTSQEECEKMLYETNISFERRTSMYQRFKFQCDQLKLHTLFPHRI